MILLDTNICLYIINARPPTVLARFRQHRLGDIGLSSVAAAELAFDEAAVWSYGTLRADLERRGTPIGTLDTMIAAHALSRQALLVTHNTREFAQVSGLQLADWTVDT